MPASAPPAISVVIPAHNAEATLGATLAALVAQRCDCPFEVIVVDSASVDGTRALVQQTSAKHPWVRLLDNPRGEPASSRNLGVATARAPLLAFTDADCVPEPGWLAAGLAALRGADAGAPAGTDAGAAAARADLVQGRVLPAGPHGRFDRTLSVGHESGLYETANLFLRRAMFDAAGGFVSLPGFGEERPFGEDTCFAWRARRLGARTAFCAAAVVRHAVFTRGAGGYIAEQRRRRHFPALVRAVPELRGTFLYRRWFLSPTSARFDLALAGAGLAATGAGLAATGGGLAATGGGLAVAGARRRGRALAVALGAGAALPYALTLPRRRPTEALAQIAADAVGAAALLKGSLAARTPVL